MRPLIPVIDVGGSPRPTVSIGTSESETASEPWLPPPTWLRPARSENSHPGAAEAINLQPVGSHARACQVRQARKVLEIHRLI